MVEGDIMIEIIWMEILVPVLKEYLDIIYQLNQCQYLKAEVMDQIIFKIFFIK